MRKIVCVLFAALMVFSLNTFAYATEVDDLGETDTGSSVVNGSDNLDNLENGENGADSTGEEGTGVDGGTNEVLEDPLAVGEDGSNPVVDISDESIQAIADAINAAADYEFLYEFQYYITADTGKSYILDTNVENLLFDHRLMIGDFNGSTRIGLFDGFEFGYVDGNPNYFYSYNENGLAANAPMLYFNYTDTVISFENLDAFTVDSGNRYRVRSYEWTNFNIYDRFTGELVYKSAYAPPPLVSFVTGFDDLTISSKRYTENFTLPIPEKDGWIFNGWFYDSDFSEEYRMEEITDDVTLYAKWTEAPPFSFVADNIFDSLIEFLSFGPVFYIISLMGLLCVIAFIKMLITTRA